MRPMRIDPLAFFLVFLALVLVIGGTLFGLYMLFNRLLAYLERHEK